MCFCVRRSGATCCLEGCLPKPWTTQRTTGCQTGPGRTSWASAHWRSSAPWRRPSAGTRRGSKTSLTAFSLTGVQGGVDLLTIRFFARLCPEVQATKYKYYTNDQYVVLHNCLYFLLFTWEKYALLVFLVQIISNNSSHKTVLTVTVFCASTHAFTLAKSVNTFVTPAGD